MHEPDFWTQSAEAMEMTIEGNRLISLEIAARARNLWQRMSRTLVGHFNARHRNLPPI